MKHNTATPSLPLLHLGEIQNISSVEWSPQYVIAQEESRKLNVSPPSLSPETRRVSAGSISSSTSSSISTISSSSSSSSFGFGTYDDPYDIISETSTNEKDDPIISFEALSLETRRIAVSVTPTSTIAPSEEDEQKHHHKHKNPIEPLGRMKPTRLQQCQESSPKSLNLAASFEGKDGISRRSNPKMQPILSALAPKKGQQQEEWNINDLMATNASSHGASGRPEQEYQRRTFSKKYIIRKTASTVPSNSCSLPFANESSIVSRPKRQRGGSDFSMLSEGNATTSTSPTDRRKRRRMNRNRAMAADEFDSILSQINTTGSL